MEKIVFEESRNKNSKTTAVRVSKENHDRILEISDRSSMTAYAVADKLLTFALDRVEWDKQ